MLWTRMENGQSIVTEVPGPIICTLFYHSPTGSVSEPELNFTDTIRMSLLHRGDASVRCTSPNGTFSQTINRTLLDNTDVVLKCTDIRLVYLDPNQDGFFEVCKHQAIVDGQMLRLENTSLADCQDTKGELKFIGGKIVLNRSTSVGYFDIQCDDGSFKATFLIYDDTLTLRPFNNKRVWFLKVDKKVPFEFVFARKNISVLLLPSHIEAECSIENELLGTFNGLDLILNPDAVPVFARQRVECGIHERVIVRTTWTNELYISIDLSQMDRTEAHYLFRMIVDFDSIQQHLTHTIPAQRRKRGRRLGMVLKDPSTELQSVRPFRTSGSIKEDVNLRI
ncbi:unnamed protein product [Dicrocoelium dendriticum]|nr:unnamed protein product [Dicrocoelium dendriticum]